jgi:GT2 family glycosyltransferase
VNVESKAPDLSVVIVNWNTLERLRDCLSSITEQLGSVAHEVIVIDNDSSDGSPEMVENEFAEVRLVRNTENTGFGRANNQGMRLARGEWFLLLNSDTVLTDDSVAHLFEKVRHDPKVGIAQCRIVFPDGRTQFTTYRFPGVGRAAFEAFGLYKLVPKERAGSILLTGYWNYDEEREVDWVAGAFMLLPREVFEQTGGFDESIFMYGEDLEWCYRIRDRGWQIRYYPDATIVHFDHASADIRWGQERIALCLRRQRDIYATRAGRLHGFALTSLQLIGALLRTAYFAVRAGLGGKKASAYSAERQNAAYTVKALFALTTERR